MTMPTGRVQPDIQTLRKPWLYSERQLREAIRIHRQMRRGVLVVCVPPARGDDR